MPEQFETEISQLLKDCNQMRVFLFESKQGRGGGYNIYLFPNEPTGEMLSDFKANFELFTNGKDIVDYSQTEAKKGAIQKLQIDELPQWAEIKELIDTVPITNAPIFTPDRISKRIKMIVVECTIADGKVFLISKFGYKSVYGRKIRFSLTQNTFKKLDNAVLTLGENIDCFIFQNYIYLLIEAHFDTLFSFHKRIKDAVSATLPDVDSWDFFNNNGAIADEVSNKSRRGLQFVKAANSDNLSKWKEKTPSERKALILGDIKLKDKFTFDENDRIILTKESFSEFFRLLTDEYYKSIITGETGER